MQLQRRMHQCRDGEKLIFVPAVRGPVSTPPVDPVFRREVVSLMLSSTYEVNLVVEAGEEIECKTRIERF